MELKICWFYPELMTLYGDKGNIDTLKYRCEKRNIQCIVDTCSFKEEKDLLSYDLLIIGGACENAFILNDLKERINDFKAYIESGKFLLLLCGGYQIFGQSFMDSNNKVYEGLKLLPYTSTLDQQMIGDIVLSVKLQDEEIYVVGFENHKSITTDITKPFGNKINGKGMEGYLDNNILGTYLHGPLLPKNPKVCDYIILNALKNKGLTSLCQIDDTIEEKALETVLKIFKVK